VSTQQREHPNLFREQILCRLDGETTQIYSRNKFGIDLMEDAPKLKSGVDSMGRVSQTCSRNKSGVDSMEDVPEVCSGNKSRVDLDGGRTPHLCKPHICSGNNFTFESRNHMYLANVLFYYLRNTFTYTYKGLEGNNTR